MVPWNVDNAKQAIQNFCTDTTDGFVVDPATPTPRATSFSQSRGPYPYQDYRYGANTTDHVTSIFVAFTQDAQACSPPTKFSISDYSDQCTKLLTQVLEDPDACPGNTGGNVKEEAADHGCVTWQMFQWSLP